MRGVNSDKDGEEMKKQRGDLGNFEKKRSLKDFFNREASRYQQFIKGRDFVTFLKEKVNSHLKGRVLDVGSGRISDFEDGSFNYYVAMDISLAMLQGLKPKGRIERVCGDARALPFREGAFDLLIYRSVLHHLNPNGMPKDEMERSLKELLIEARRVVKRDGKVLVIEPCFPPFLETVEHILTPFIRWVMRLLGLPYVFLFSYRRLTVLLKKGGWDSLRVTHIKGTGKSREWITPVLGLPHVKIPRGLSPSKVYLIEGSKE